MPTLETFIAEIQRCRDALAALNTVMEDHLGYLPDDITPEHVGQAARLRFEIERAAKLIGYDYREVNELCHKCGSPTDDGEGYNGLCGNCADKADPDSI